MKGLCRVVTYGFLALYAVALMVWLVGTFGLFGQPTDPLSGVFLIPLGLPWNKFIDSLPEPFWPWLAAAAPLINCGILLFLCRFARRNER